MKINKSKVSKPTFVKSRNQWRLIKKDPDGKIVERLFYDTKEEADTIYVHLVSEQEANLKVDKVSESEISTSLATEDTKLKILTAHDMMFDMLIEGYARSTIIAAGMDQFKMKRSQAMMVLKEVLDAVSMYALSNIDDIITIHTKRYEEIFSSATDAGFDKLALKALRAKEQLIGLSNDSIDVVFNQENFIDEIEFEDVVLNADESKVFQQIMEKAKI